MSEIPQRPADPRPNDEPFFIDNKCLKCGTELIQDPQSLDEGFHDEFICPSDGCSENEVYMDWPDEEFNRLIERAESPENGNTIPIEEFKTRLEDD